MAPPMMKPAMTSDQWLRYSTTRLIPVRKARHMSPRESTGLASRVPLAFTEHVMYIWGKTEHSVIHLHPNRCVNAFHSSFIPCLRVGMFVWKHRFQFNSLNSGFHYNKLHANMHQLFWSVYVNIWMCLMRLQVHCKQNTCPWFSYIVSFIKDIGIDWKGGIWRLVWWYF